MIALNFHDGSCEYTEGAYEGKNRKQLYYNVEHEVNDYEFRGAGL